MVLEGQRLSIELGAAVKVDFDGADAPFKALFVGMEAPRYIVLRIPAGRGLGDQLYEGHGMIVKFVGAGKVMGFRSRIIAHLFKKSLVVAFIEYPDQVESYELRSDQRIDCYIPSRLRLAGEDYRGVVLDISKGGCRFGLNPGVKPPALELDMEATLFMKMLGVTGSQEIGCRVKNISGSQESLSVGLKFVEVTDDLEAGLQRYLTDVTSFIEGGGKEC